MLVQRLEGGERGERCAAFVLECAEGGAERAAVAAFARAETPVERFEHRAFHRRDAGVIDQPGAAHRADRVSRRQASHRRVLGKAGDRGHVDIEIIEPAPGSTANTG